MSTFDAILLIIALVAPWVVGMIIICTEAVDILSLGFPAWWAKKVSE